MTTGKHYIRQLAFVWHLAKDWRSEWGGAFYWVPKASYLPPAFNTLYLFNVGPDSTHFVTHVSPYAQGKRLVINGWWTGMTPTGDPVWKGPDRIGTGRYGNPDLLNRASGTGRRTIRPGQNTIKILT